LRSEPDDDVPAQPNNVLQGIGNGIPLGAVVTTPEIAQVLTRRCYFNTFGGNPLCTAGGLAVLKVLEKERLQENAFVVGSYLKDRLRGLQEKHESEARISLCRTGRARARLFRGEFESLYLSF